jgi:UDP-N-acetylmuramoyl-tripeptide--D-alanyl-D-alanine ligase
MSLSKLHPTKIAEICNGYWLNEDIPQFAFHHVVIDSRQMAGNSLFIALKGAHKDGHDFLASLADHPEHGAMVNKPDPEINLPQLVVADVEASFQALAKFVAHNSRARKIAITGSVGKTGTKDMIADMLAVAGKVHATKGNLNNHLGVPLTVSNMPEHNDFLVAEMGMNSAGEITLLSEIVRPDIAIITRISNTHAAFFNNLSEIAEAKAEIFLGADAFGTAILPRDDEFYGQLAGSARLSGLKNIISFGTDEDSTIRLENMEVQKQGLEITASLPHPQTQGMRQIVSFTLGMRAKHYAVNALCALAVAHALKLDLAPLLPAFAQMREGAGRGRVHQLHYAGRELTLIDDSYNASPASMQAALAAAASYNAENLLIIASDMLELGAAEIAEHRALAPAIETAKAKSVIAIGPLMQSCCQHLPEAISATYFADAKAAYAAFDKNLEAMIGAADLILIKGSHGSGAHKISAYLLDRLSGKHNGPSTPMRGVYHAA